MSISNEMLSFLSDLGLALFYAHAEVQRRQRYLANQLEMWTMACAGSGLLRMTYVPAIQ